MRPYNAVGPVTAAAVNRPQGVVLPGVDASPYTPSDSSRQCDFGPVTGAALAAHLVAARYGVAPHLAALIASLAGLGGMP
jgi:hypothetical protein